MKRYTVSWRMALDAAADGEVVYACVPGMQPWETAVVLFE